MNTHNLVIGTDGRARCWWCGDDPLYQHYHDTEWGKPVYDDVRLFEKICLEGFQAGLSWITILRKRENFRTAFEEFNFEKIAKFTDVDVQRLLKDEGIIRHRGKIEATINNAQCALDLRDETGSLSAYFWSFAALCHSDTPLCHSEAQPKNPKDMPTDPSQTLRMTKADIPSQTLQSLALSKDLKKRGWKFVGPTTCYAFMQAMGMVNDHLEDCWVKNNRN